MSRGSSTPAGGERQCSWGQFVGVGAFLVFLIAFCLYTSGPPTSAATDDAALLYQNPTPTPTPTPCPTGNMGAYVIQAGPSPYVANFYGTGGKAKPRSVGQWPGSTKVESFWVHAATGSARVEVGWYSDTQSYDPTPPTYFALWANNGAPWDEYDTVTLTKDVWQRFRVVNKYGDGTWYWYLGDPDVYQYHRTVDFLKGNSGSQGERHNLCDAGFTRLTDLQRYEYMGSPDQYAWFFYPNMLANAVYDGDPGYKYCRCSTTSWLERDEGISCNCP